MLYMALHVADPEVTKLMNEYVKETGMSKTEALRRLLRDALDRQKRRKAKASFENVAHRIINKNRTRNITPITKEEVDKIFE
jgi:hypothetical protein